jgi:hypothetical protein
MPVALGDLQAGEEEDLSCCAGSASAERSKVSIQNRRAQTFAPSGSSETGLVDRYVAYWFVRLQAAEKNHKSFLDLLAAKSLVSSCVGLSNVNQRGCHGTQDTSSKRKVGSTSMSSSRRPVSSRNSDPPRKPVTVEAMHTTQSCLSLRFARFHMALWQIVAIRVPHQQKAPILTPHQKSTGFDLPQWPLTFHATCACR